MTKTKLTGLDDDLPVLDDLKEDLMQTMYTNIEPLDTYIHV